MASEKIDLTCDSDDEDIEAAIKASLFGSYGGGAGSGAPAFSSSAGSGSIEISNSVKSKKRAKHPSSSASSSSSDGDGMGRGYGKRPRSELNKAVSNACAPAPLFRLLSTSRSDEASTGSVSIGDLLSGDFQEALLCNYMVDMGLLVVAQPRLGSVPVVVVHGDKEDSVAEEGLRMQCAQINPGIRLHRPQIPTYGTHHAKMILLKFPTGVRVVILTANFVSTDVEHKSQGVWYQEFPLREADTCDFEESLVGYLEKVGGPAALFGRTLRQYDFGSARVALVPSVPGTGKSQHKEADLHKYGHMRVRSLLSSEKLLLEDGGHKVVFQFSSLSSLTDSPNQWLAELLASFMPEEGGGKGGGGGARGVSSSTAATGTAVRKQSSAETETKLKEHLRLIWPSVGAVRTSAKGWESGGSLCCNTENMYGGRYQRPNMASYRSNNPRPELRPLLRKWEGNPAVNRGRDAPHMKTYVRYREVEGSGENGQDRRVDGDEVAWFLLTSSNLSRSAWGFLDKKTSKQLTVKSYEMGVMFLPSLLGQSPQPASNHAPAFTCTPGEMGLTQRLPLTLGGACDPGRGLPLKLLPLPYTLPAPQYNFSKGDEGNRPWVWDQEHNTLDHEGRSWPLR